MIPGALVQTFGAGQMEPRRERERERGKGQRRNRGERQRGRAREQKRACILNGWLSYTPFMLGSIFLVPDCMGMTLATLAAAERLVVLGEPVGALFEAS